MYFIQFTDNALEDLRCFRKFDQRQIVEGIERQLSQRPVHESRNRKRLRANPIATWELRLGDFRVFYEILRRDEVVRIEAIGWKSGNLLYIRGVRRDL